MEPAEWILWVGAAFMMGGALAMVSGRQKVAPFAVFVGGLAWIAYAVTAAMAGEFVGAVLPAVLGASLVGVLILFSWPLYLRLFRWLHLPGRAGGSSTDRDVW